MKRDSFSMYNPILNLFYFTFVIGVNMFVMHPIFLGISLIAGTLYEARLSGIKASIKNLFIFSIPVMVLVALINPMFNHYGVTALFYLKNGNAITLESLIYGLVMAMMLCGVMANFRCVNKVMTTDKFVYIFGRILPKFSLIIAMVMRFVPEFTKRQKVISNGQKGIGRDLSNGNFFEKMRNGITSISILITWSLEKAIDTADSMKARGYGLSGRSSFGIFGFYKRDLKLLTFMVIVSGSFLWGAAKGFVYADYDPKIVISGWNGTVYGLIMYFLYAGFCFMPVVLDMVENISWNLLIRKVNADKVVNYRVWDI